MEKWLESVYSDGSRYFVSVPEPELGQTVRKGKVRRAKLYYLRDRVGKAAKVKEDL